MLEKRGVVTTPQEKQAAEKAKKAGDLYIKEKNRGKEEEAESGTRSSGRAPSED
jgi:hypothetical protein